jgi:hypothetical protein
MKALVFIFGRRRSKLLVLAVAALALALAAPALAAESHVEASCETGTVGSETSETGDVSLGSQWSSARSLALKASASALSLDGPHRYCDALARFSNTITVEPGSSGLSAGDPVTLRLSVTMNGALGASPRTSDMSFVASALRNATLQVTVPDRIVCAPDDGREICRPAELATFNAHTMFKVEGSPPTPGYPGVARDHLEWGWTLAGNRGPALGDSGTRSLQECVWPGQFPCLIVDQPPPDPDYAGTRTVLVDALVGDRVELFGALDVLAQAIWGAAHVDFSSAVLYMHAELTPAPGFEGLRLVKELAPPADPPAEQPPSDTESPTLGVPADLTTDATGPTGTAVTYTVTATDNVAEGLTSTCSPASGETFPIGTTTVTCTATDAAGNTATASFAVTVVGASGQIVQLIDKTLQFLDRPVLSAAFKATLQSTLNSVVAGRKVVACTGLRLYTLAVRMAGTAFTSAERNELLADASRIRAVLGCA